MAKLVDVYIGTATRPWCLDAPIRARSRHGRMPDEVKMMTPGAPEELEIDLWSTAITFEKGHRLAWSTSPPRTACVSGGEPQHRRGGRQLQAGFASRPTASTWTRPTHRPWKLAVVYPDPK